MMLLTIALIAAAMAALAALEIWLFWKLDERDDRRSAAKRATGDVSRGEVRPARDASQSRRVSTVS